MNEKDKHIALLEKALTIAVSRTMRNASCYELFGDNYLNHCAVIPDCEHCDLRQKLCIQKAEEELR